MTKYEKEVKKKLIEEEKTQKDFRKEIENITGLKVDSSYMCKILSGQRRPPKIVKAIYELTGVNP